MQSSSSSSLACQGFARLPPREIRVCRTVLAPPAAQSHLQERQEEESPLQGPSGVIFGMPQLAEDRIRVPFCTGQNLSRNSVAVFEAKLLIVYPILVSKFIKLTVFQCVCM